jgi:hypothetical protein
MDGTIGPIISLGKRPKMSCADIEFVSHNNTFKSRFAKIVHQLIFLQK